MTVGNMRSAQISQVWAGVSVSASKKQTLRQKIQLCEARKSAGVDTTPLQQASAAVAAAVGTSLAF